MEKQPDARSAAAAAPEAAAPTLEAQREQLVQQADVMFGKISAYMEAELGGSCS